MRFESKIGPVRESRYGIFVSIGVAFWAYFLVTAATEAIASSNETTSQLHSEKEHADRLS